MQLRLGDTDGVIVIPRLDALALLGAARKFSASDKAKAEAAMKGTSELSAKHSTCPTFRRG